ncbi:MAG: YeeE/YedE thiosulfate transporter family protein [Sulfuricurvum sp.]|uniref:YeeE/YedE thiosulfate transporter family protein n=1 Tax=Sulfuricurvum sp. TaxID=2025608 RepID=UPI0026128D0F|nr:YeeE/YedE thiosulfate transporter family protein [Sulfuricurvum sp.]MDD5160774.1 YeeE/YedE thiosulfate transporter family protein [Sulfuricurvum sp.]
MNFPLEYTSGIMIIIAGFFFGYFLEVSGLGSPRKLNAQFTFKDWSVFKVMFVAIVVAATGLWLFDILGWVRFDALKIQTTFFWAMAAGGALLGAGLAVGGYCPGTSVVGFFSGRLDALVFMIGMVIGVFIFALSFDDLQGLYTAAKGANRETLPQLLHVPTWVILVGLIALATAGFRIGSKMEAKEKSVIRAQDLESDK